ncbi:MAG: insulinase family protein [Gemmatimonadaceae bacterium]
MKLDVQPAVRYAIAPRAPFLAALGAAAVAALGPAPARAQDRPPFPTRPPAAAPVTPAQFPPFQEATLANGLRVVLVESHRQPVLSLSLAFPAGNALEPAGKEGLADMVAGLLTKGAGKRSADEIAETIEGVGGSIGAAAGPDFLTVRTDVLSSSAPLAFEILGDAVARPSFAEKEVELLRTQTLSSLQLELSQPASLASRFFARELYGKNAYARRATPASVQAITRADLVAFQRARLRPRGGLLVVAGDITMPDVQRLAARAFAGWMGGGPAAEAAVAPPVRTRTEILLVHRPGSVQSNIVVGNTTFPPTDRRFYAATVANKVLGGGADSRLFLILREQKSWTYGAYSSLERPKGVGAFQATAEVRTEVTDSALVEMLAQLRRIGAEPVPAVELDAAKGALVGSFPLSIETAEQVATAVTRARLLGLPADYLQTYRPRLAAVTPVQLRTTARTTIRPDAATIVVVGDGTKIYERLRTIAPVRIVSTDGTPLAASELTTDRTTDRTTRAATAATLPFDLGKLAPRSDSFTVMVQGTPLGWQKTALEKTPTGFRYTDETRIAALVQQSTELTFSASGEMQAVRQTGKFQGKDTKVDVTYAGGRARGSAATPTPQGTVDAVTVDAALPAGVVDDNAVQALVPALRWAPDARFDLAVFSPGKNAVRPMTLAVKGTERVTVPAGTFDVYRAELTGGEQAVTMYVTTAAPNRVVKVALAGTPLEIVLAK